MSEQALESDNVDDVYKTSEEMSTADSGEKSKGLTDSFNIYNAMMVFSLVCIALAIYFMFSELSQFGNILSGEFPWRTSDAIIGN